MFNLVDRAALAPGGCMICRSAKAPLLDLMQEFSAQQLRLYLCEIHGKEVARAFGLVKGDAMDDLLRVRDELIVKEREHGELQERFDNLRADMEKLFALNDAQKAELEREQQRAEQLQQQLDDVREATTATLAATKEPDYEPALD